MGFELTTLQFTKLPLWQKIRKMGMIRIAKSVLTEDLCIAQKEKLLITCYKCDIHT
jgi:hypothetical protein